MHAGSGTGNAPADADDVDDIDVYETPSASAGGSTATPSTKFMDRTCTSHSKEVMQQLPDRISNHLPFEHVEGMADSSILSAHARCCTTAFGCSLGSSWVIHVAG
jgi:hypothetical protein